MLYVLSVVTTTMITDIRLFMQPYEDTLEAECGFFPKYVKESSSIFKYDFNK